MMNLIEILYSTVGVVVVFGYVPQILRIWKSKTDCHDISLRAWMIWNYTAIVSLLYGVFELHDLKFTLVNIANVVCISLIIGLTYLKRTKTRKR